MDAPDVLRALHTPQGRANPYPHYAMLHALGPAAPLAGSYAAVVHGYEAVTEVLRDPVFQALDAGRLERDLPGWREHPSLRVLMDTMMFMNGAAHARKRRLITQAFTARRVAALEHDVTALVDELLDRIAELGADGAAVDFMDEFAYPLPSNVIGALLGVPAQDRAWFQPHVRAIGAVLEATGDAKWPAGDKAAVELSAYFEELVRDRRAHPRDDLVSVLTAARDGDGDRLSESELISTLILLFNAGFETTSHLLGNGLAVLLRNPRAADRLREDPALAGAYVDEFLRLESPAQLTVRWAAADTTVGQIPVPAGAMVLVLFGAANRDPARFAEADLFRPDRPDNQHLTFSAGPHFCPGALLSMTEARIAFPRLLARFPRLAVVGEPAYREQLTLRGHTRLPVSVA